MNHRKFKVINEAFKCESCQKDVPKAASSCRNHCPFCLSSKHVDTFPGDRANPCKGLLRAFAYSESSQKGLTLHFKCEKCAQITQNIAIQYDEIEPDSYDKILALGPL